MDDSCAVCADSLEWVAYGACGHREVCSTCVARLRFICEDRWCCICKTECNVVFVTKALGDYTRMINDFSVLPSELREGKVGPYWYHEDTQAFFDDGDHYKMIKAMCRLSCSVCDRMDEQPNDGSRRQGKFRNIKQLKGHLFHRHKLLMCSLCLEGRKVFICEQKLYIRAQLNQHISTGDSEVDGSESERGGFNGHPRCEFCRTPFYGDNELYSHMSTEHYTCHICQRQHPGQYEYYKNYDDLEIHFRRDHYLCEDEACLGKKFIVFQSEAELKRHNTIEHGGRMSRAKRNAALQIPTSFRYRRSNEDNRRGRGQTFHPEPVDYQLSMAIEASLVTTAGEPPSSSSGQVVSDHGDPNSIDPIVQPFEALSTTDSEPPSRYLQAVAQGLRGVPLEETSFPPLSMASSTSQQSAKSNSEALPSNTMAAHLRRQRNVHVLNSAQARPVASHRSVQPSSSPVQFRPTTPATSHGASTGAAVLGYASSALGKAQSTTVNGLISSGSSSASSGNAGRISHSASTSSLADGQPLIPSASDFPPVSTTQMQKMPSSSHAPTNVEGVHTANKSLVEKIRAALEYDEDKYTAFKDISAQYRQGLIDTGKYLNYVQQYELSHLLLELARLCPDVQKQRELIETYNASMRSNGLQARIGGHGNLRLKDDNSSRKGKGKSLVTKDGHSKDTLADSVISTVRELQSNNNPTEEEVEVLSKDGYRGTEGKLKVMANEQLVELSSQNHPAIKIGSKNDSVSTGGGSGVGGGGGGGKQRKKTSKFQRLRLGDGSMEAILDPKNSEPEQPDHMLDGNQNPAGGLPVRGVWRTGGGQKLFP